MENNLSKTKTYSSVDYLIQKINGSGIKTHFNKEEMREILQSGKNVQKLAVKYGTSEFLENKDNNKFGTFVVSMNEENAKFLGIKIAARKYGGTFYINNQTLKSFLQEKNFSPFWGKRIDDLNSNIKNHSIENLKNEILWADVKGNKTLEKEQSTLINLVNLDLVEYKKEQTYLYSVTIPDNNNNNYLLYNNPIGLENANKINEQLNQMGVNWTASRNDTGKSIYFELLSKNVFNGDQEKSSELLNNAGYVGLQMDNSNFMIFNNSDMKVTDRIQYMMDKAGEVYGFAYQGEIYIDEDLINSNVLAHEYTHIWDSYCKNNNPELWNKGIAILKDTSIWNQIKEDKNYENLKTDDEILSEVHSRITGEFAEKVLERIEKEDGAFIKNSAIDWDKEVNEYISNELFGPQGIENNSTNNSVKAEYLKQFLSLPMKDLMNEVKIGRLIDENIGLRKENQYYSDLLNKHAVIQIGAKQVEAANGLVKGFANAVQKTWSLANTCNALENKIDDLKHQLKDAAKVDLYADVER